MTAKKFIQLSDLLRKHTVIYEDAALLAEFAKFCRSQNPQFKEARWYDYIYGMCGPRGGKVKQ